MAETITYSDLRRGMTIEMDGEAYQVLEWKHVVMQQRTPTLNLKLRHIKTNKTYNRNIPGDRRLTLADVETREAQYLYTDGRDYFFMDTQTYEQSPLSQEKLGDLVKFLKEGATLSLVFYKGESISVELTNTVDLVVTEATSSYKGDTAQGGRKPVTLETGLSVKVPMHVNVGQVVRVDTRSGEYVEMVS